MNTSPLLYVFNLFYLFFIFLHFSYRGRVCIKVLESPCPVVELIRSQLKNNSANIVFDNEHREDVDVAYSHGLGDNEACNLYKFCLVFLLLSFLKKKFINLSLSTFVCF